MTAETQLRQVPFSLSYNRPLTRVQHFSKDHFYYLSLLDMDGSPLIPGSDQPRTKSYNSHQSFRGNHSRGYHGQRGHRSGPPRGGYRGFSRNRQSQYHQENAHPRGGYENVHHRGGYQNFPNIVHGMPYGDHPPFYPPPPPGNGFAPPPFIINGQPVYGNRHPPGLLHPPPGTFASGLSNGPFIVNGQPPYSPIPPTFWGEPYQSNNGYYSPPFNMPNYSEGYFNQTGQMGYNEPYLQNVAHLTVPDSNNKPTPPPKVVVTIKKDTRASNSPEVVKEGDKSDKKTESDESPGTERETKTEIDLFNLEDPGKIPRLIRVHHSDSEDTDYEESASETDSKIELKPEPEKPALVPVTEEVGDDGTTAEAISESGSSPVSDSDKSKNTRILHSEQIIRDESPNDTDSISDSSSQTRSLDEKYQLKTGKTIEDYVRLGAESLRNEYTEGTLLDIIRELEEEQQVQKDK